METICISSKQPFQLKRVAEMLSRHWPVEDSPDNTLVVHGAGSRAYLYQSHANDGEFLLLIDYSDVELVKQLLEKIADDSAVTVDNDFGTVLPGNQFVTRCKSDSKWDWRQ